MFNKSKITSLLLQYVCKHNTIQIYSHTTDFMDNQNRLFISVPMLPLSGIPLTVLIKCDE